MKYKDNMTPEELTKFMEEVNALDALLSSLPKPEPAPDEWEDPSDYVGMGWVGRDGRP
jgi:pyruvate dehydrogenase complex dehydrogenase (E1) component